MRGRPGNERNVQCVDVFEVVDDASRSAALLPPHCRERWFSPDLTVMVICACLLAAAWFSASGPPEGVSGTGPVNLSHHRVAPLLADVASIDESGSRCVDVTGRYLMLSEQIVNTSGDALVLRRVQAVLPMGGLTVLDVAGGACSQGTPRLELTGLTLPGLARVWVVVRLRIVAACPAPYPVQFRVIYSQFGAERAVMLTGFVDLGGVRFPSCPPAVRVKRRVA